MANFAYQTMANFAYQIMAYLTHTCCVVGMLKANECGGQVIKFCVRIILYGLHNHYM